MKKYEDYVIAPSGRRHYAAKVMFSAEKNYVIALCGKHVTIPKVDEDRKERSLCSTCGSVVEAYLSGFESPYAGDFGPPERAR